MMLLRGLLGSALLVGVATPTGAETRTYLDLEGTIGYSTNPLLQPGSDAGAGYGRLSAYGFHGWRSERGETRLSAYVENSSYFRRYGSLQNFALTAETQNRVSETVGLFGSLKFRGDIGGQLSTRFYGAPLQELPPEGTASPPPTDITPVIDLATLNRRQYRITGQGGATFALSPRDNVTASLGAQRVIFSGSGNQIDYNSYDAGVAWQRQLNERLAVGAQLVVEIADYSGGRSIRSYGPQLTVGARLNERLKLNAAVGVVRTERNLGPLLGGDSSSFDLALDASLCRNLEYDQFCARVSRRTQSSAIGAAPVTTTGSADYSRRLSANDLVQLSLSYSRTERVRGIDFGRQSYVTVNGSYSRKISERLSAGLSVSGRKRSQSGVDIKDDLAASLFIRNRIGSLR